MTATMEDAAPAAPDAEEPRPRSQSWRGRLLPLVDARGGWLATAIVAAIGGLLRFVRLDLPAGRIFDEVYYVCDAQNLLRYGVEHDTVDNNPNCIPEGGAGFVVHPPLGKWAIALGIRIVGTNEFGWRVAAAIAGTLMIVMLVRTARRMTGSTLLGCLAGLLLSLDGLHFVQSRTAMLDIFLALWITAAFACLVIDRDDVRRRLASADDAVLGGHGPRLGIRPWRIAAGVCLGAAVATKWSGLYYVVAMLLLAFAWEVGARRTAGVLAPVRATISRSTLGLAGALVLLPAALYVMSWTGWFLTDDLGWDRNWAESNPSKHFGFLPDVLRSWWHYHVEIFGFHDNLRSRHPYQSHPAGWLVLARPISYYYPGGITAGAYGCTVASCSREVLAIGTPAIWWATIPALLILVWMWLARRDWRAAAALVMVGVGIAPWIRDDLDGRTMFLFYALPSVSFMCLAITLVAGWLLTWARGHSRRWRVTVAGIAAYVAVVVVNFAYLYPVLAAQTLPYDVWKKRMWFSSWI